MTNRVRTATIAISFLLASPLFAQVAVQEHDSRMQAAMRLVHLVSPRDSYREQLRTMYAGMTPMFEQASAQGSLPADFAERMTKVMEEVLPYESYTRMFAELYAAHFTTEELNDLLRFYRSPTGAKMLSVSAQIGTEVVTRMNDQLMPKIQEAMRKQGLIR